MAVNSIQKYIAATAVVLLLIIAPLGSYMYLRTGFTYRLDYIQELKPESQVPFTIGKQQFIVKTNGKVRLVHIPQNDVQGEIDVLTEVDNNIVTREFYEAYSFAPATYKKEDSTIKFVSDSTITYYGEAPILMIDRNGLLRFEYELNNETAKKLIKHLSVMIPRPEKVEVKLKRDMKDYE